MLPERKAQGVNLMKNYIAAIITIVFFICPSICFSSYLIELKNGSTFITNHYWKEGRQIKFYHYGGVVGIEKEFVRKIRESDVPIIEHHEEPHRPNTTAADSTDEVEEKEASKKAFDNAIDYKNEQMSLKSQLKEALSRYKRAKEHDDKEMVDTEYRKVSKLSAELEHFKKEVTTKNNGTLPEWWN